MTFECLRPEFPYHGEEDNENRKETIEILGQNTCDTLEQGGVHQFDRLQQDAEQENRLLLRLINLLIDLLASLTAVPVIEEHGACVLHNLELSADDSEAKFDNALSVLGALVLVVVCL